jgi:hypothetical protein
MDVRMRGVIRWSKLHQVSREVPGVVVREIIGAIV